MGKIPIENWNVKISYVVAIGQKVMMLGRAVAMVMERREMKRKA